MMLLEAITLVQRELFSQRVTLGLELEPAYPQSSLIESSYTGDHQLVMNGVTRWQPVADRRATADPVSPGRARQLVLTVKNCGIGISARSADHLFDAFFTTKSSGMGMGLSICRSIYRST